MSLVLLRRCIDNLHRVPTRHFSSGSDLMRDVIRSDVRRSLQESVTQCSALYESQANEREHKYVIGISSHKPYLVSGELSSVSLDPLRTVHLVLRMSKHVEVYEGRRLVLESVIQNGDIRNVVDIS